MRLSVRQNMYRTSNSSAGKLRVKGVANRWLLRRYTQASMEAMLTNATLARLWHMQMTDSLARYGMRFGFGGVQPTDWLMSTEQQVVTNGRISDDYHANLHDEGALNWNIGACLSHNETTDARCCCQLLKWKLCMTRQTETVHCSCYSDQFAHCCRHGIDFWLGSLGDPGKRWMVVDAGSTWPSIQGQPHRESWRTARCGCHALTWPGEPSRQARAIQSLTDNAELYGGRNIALSGSPRAGA